MIFKNSNKTKKFLNQRERLMRSTWKHGIVGVENPDSPQSDVHVETHNVQHKAYIIKERRAKARQVNLVKYA